MKTSSYNLNARALYEAILGLKDLAEAKRFFRDLLTREEIKEFGLRWKTARMLANDIPYSQIKKQTGLSATTIARISKWLKKGKGGYQLMINRIHHHISRPFEKAKC